jgi:hypothetical protein
LSPGLIGLQDLKRFFKSFGNFIFLEVFVFGLFDPQLGDNDVFVYFEPASSRVFLEQFTGQPSIAIIPSGFGRLHDPGSPCPNPSNTDWISDSLFSSSIAILFESCPTFEAPTHGKIAMFAPQQPHFSSSAIIYYLYFDLFFVNV